MLKNEKKEIEEIEEMMNKVLDERMPKESELERRARVKKEIMSIRNTEERQRAISQNMDVFRG